MCGGTVHEEVSLLAARAGGGPKLRAMNTPQAVDPCRCPLCGAPNHCAMEQSLAGGSQQPCWCTRAQFSAQLLQQVPEPLRGKACICPACVKASQSVA